MANSAAIELYVRTRKAYDLAADDFKSKRGELRSTASILRATLQSTLPEGVDQIALPLQTKDSKPLYVRRLRYSAPKAITAKILKDACDKVTHKWQGNASQLQAQILNAVKGQIRCTREYADIVEAPLRSTDKSRREAVQNPSDTVAQLAISLVAARNELLRLKAQEKATLHTTKNQLKALETQVYDHLSSLNTTKVALPRGGVELKTQRRSPPLTLPALGNIITHAIDACNGDPQRLTAKVLECTQLWKRASARVTRVVKLTKKPQAR